MQLPTTPSRSHSAGVVRTWMNTDAVCPWPEPPLRPQAGVRVHSGRTGPEHSRKLHKMLSIVPAFGKPSTSCRTVVSFPKFSVERKFRVHKIHHLNPFKLYNSVLFFFFSIFTILCNHYLILEHFHYPKRNLISPNSLFPPIPWQPVICSLSPMVVCSGHVI